MDPWTRLSGLQPTSDTAHLCDTGQVTEPFWTWDPLYVNSNNNNSTALRSCWEELKHTKGLNSSWLIVGAERELINKILAEKHLIRITNFLILISYLYNNLLITSQLSVSSVEEGSMDVVTRPVWELCISHHKFINLWILFNVLTKPGFWINKTEAQTLTVSQTHLAL